MLAVISEKNESKNVCVFFYQTTKDEEDHKEAAQGGFGIDVSITNGGHGNHEQVHTLPVRKGLGILEVFPRIP